ncbi:metal ABC transporter ATP-binding protein [Anthocerotibacter panamensis]|uniref:metal ABC transporter ATP-binding protein n=1 Tax=Anthocerotibacter panamensis TaxID=2857077 RepID=UPI001C40178A|nr:metal ABC transporter ATP-binding protein [Anthocerotibacter panamensis]
MSPVLALEHLWVQRGMQTILTDVNLALPRGALAALVGPNGAGKSTLLQAILGLVPYRGVVRVLGEDRLRGQSCCALGYVPQRVVQPEPFPLTVQELAAAGAKRRGLWWPGALTARTRVALEQLGIAHLARRSVAELSGGEFQRVLIAHALMGEREILLLDEPTTGLDPQGVEDLLDLCVRLCRDWNLTLLVVSHDLDWVARWADYAIYLNRTVVAQGAPGLVLSALERPFVNHG